VSPVPQSGSITKSEQQTEEDNESDEMEDYESEEDGEEVPVSSMTKTKQQEEDAIEEEKEHESKQVEEQALEKEDAHRPEEHCDSEDEDEDEDEEEDEDEVPVFSVPQACSTTKSHHSQQKEVVIEERDYDNAEDYDSEEDEEDALEREVSWSFWSSLARRKQSGPPPEFMGDERRPLDTTDTRPGLPAMSTGIVESTSDGPLTGPEPQLTNSNREPDSKSIRIREKFLHQLQFLKFSGDRDTKPSTVDWFLQLVAEYVRLGGGIGVSQDDRLINTVLENLSREPRGGKDRAYRWAISWIGSRSGLSIYTAGSYAWVINYGTGKNVYTPPSTVPIHQHYSFSWIEFVDAFTDEFDPERREASGFRKKAFDRGRREPSMSCGEESHWRRKYSRHGQARSEQSTVTLQAQPEQRQSDRWPLQNDNLRGSSAFRYRTRDSGACKKDSENVRVLEERVALLEKHIACLERELKAIHTKSSTVSIAPEKAQQGTSHGCRVCPQTFESSTQLHRHLRNSKHFSPPPSPTSSEGVSASGSSASEYFIPAGPFSSAVLTAPSRDDLQAKLPNLAGLKGDIQLKANTGNHTASKSDGEAALKAKRMAPEVALAEMQSLPVPADAGTTKWKKEAENQKALATKWRDRCNTIRELACKIPGYNDPKLATLDACKVFMFFIMLRILLLRRS
jgi:hypothetical protein